MAKRKTEDSSVAVVEDDEVSADSQAVETEVVAAPSWRDLAKEHNLDLSSYEDDASAVKHIAEQVQALETTRQEAEEVRRQAAEARQLAEYGQQFLPYASEFQAFMQQRQQASQQQPPNPYARPEWNPAWEGLLTTDDDGRVVPNERLGGNLDIVNKYHAVQQWKRNFLNEPEKHLEGFVQQQARSIVEPLIQEQLTNLRRQIAAEQFVATNDWLWEKDASGQPVYERNQQGQFARKMSAEGRSYQNDLTEAQAAGLPSEAQEFYANKMRTMRLAQQRQEPVKTAGDVKTEFLKNAAGHGAQPAASTHPPLKGNEPPQNSNQSYADMLRAALGEGGYGPGTEIN
jgi:hypothetical protein